MKNTSDSIKTLHPITVNYLKNKCWSNTIWVTHHWKTVFLAWITNELLENLAWLQTCSHFYFCEKILPQKIFHFSLKIFWPLFFCDECLSKNTNMYCILSAQCMSLHNKTMLFENIFLFKYSSFTMCSFLWYIRVM